MRRHKLVPGLFETSGRRWQGWCKVSVRPMGSFLFCHATQIRHQYGVEVVSLGTIPEKTERLSASERSSAPVAIFFIVMPLFRMKCARRDKSCLPRGLLTPYYLRWRVPLEVTFKWGAFIGISMLLDCHLHIPMCISKFGDALLHQLRQNQVSAERTVNSPVVVAALSPSEYSTGLARLPHCAECTLAI